MHIILEIMVLTLCSSEWSWRFGGRHHSHLQCRGVSQTKNKYKEKAVVCLFYSWPWIWRRYTCLDLPANYTVLYPIEAYPPHSQCPRNLNCNTIFTFAGRNFSSVHLYSIESRALLMSRRCSCYKGDGAQRGALGSPLNQWNRPAPINHFWIFKSQEPWHEHARRVSNCALHVTQKKKTRVSRNEYSSAFENT